jgi:hypothetical protein
LVYGLVPALLLWFMLGLGTAWLFGAVHRFFTS